MRCYLHPGREAASYCTVCGNFYCERCISVCEDGKNYCHACRTKTSLRTQEEASPRDSKLATKLMVKFKNGKSVQGTTYKIDPARSSFKLTPYIAKGGGEEREIEFSTVKYVALVESLMGEKAAGVREYQPKGSEVSVTFQDGETVRGYTLKAYSDKDQRFSVIPEDPRDNRVSIIIERSAVEKMSLGRIPKLQELRVLADNSIRRLILHYYWQHPDIIITIDELAARLERTAAAVERELDEFTREGLIRKITPDGRQLKFTPAKDPVVRQAVSSMAKDIEMLYFRKKPTAPAEPQAQRPSKPAPQWPL